MLLPANRIDNHTKILKKLHETQFIHIPQYFSAQDTTTLQQIAQNILSHQQHLQSTYHI